MVRAHPSVNDLHNRIDETTPKEHRRGPSRTLCVDPLRHVEAPQHRRGDRPLTRLASRLSRICIHVCMCLCGVVRTRESLCLCVSRVPAKAVNMLASVGTTIDTIFGESDAV